MSLFNILNSQIICLISESYINIILNLQLQQITYECLCLQITVTLYLSDLFTLCLSPLVIQCSCLSDMLTLFV
jgi:hypothetical protein